MVKMAPRAVVIGGFNWELVGLLPRWFSYMGLRTGVVPLAGLCGQRKPLAGLCHHFRLSMVSGCVPWQGGVTG